MQKSAKFTTIAALVLLLAVSLGAFAQAPNTIMFQGRLTNADGDPLVGTVTNVKFTIYRDPAPDVSNPIYYTVTKSITCDDNGVFTTELGPITDPNAFSGGVRYLGIKIGTDSEMEPYQELTSALYSFSTSNIPNNSVTTAKIAAGGVTNTDIADNAVTSSKVSNGSLTDVDIADEPGISANHTNIVTLTQGATAAVDIVTTQITIPTSGYIVIQARCFLDVSGTLGRNQAFLQIDETAGGSWSTTYAQMVGLGAYGDASFNTIPVYVDRVYSKSAGSYTFRLEAVASSSNSSGAVTKVRYNFITAMFFPTGYGSVSTKVSTEEGYEKNLSPEGISLDEGN